MHEANVILIYFKSSFKCKKLFIYLFRMFLCRIKKNNVFYKYGFNNSRFKRLKIIHFITNENIIMSINWFNFLQLWKFHFNPCTNRDGIIFITEEPDKGIELI